PAEGGDRALADRPPRRASARRSDQGHRPVGQGRSVLADPQAGRGGHGHRALCLRGCRAARQCRPHPRLQRRRDPARADRRGAHPLQPLPGRIRGCVMASIEAPARPRSSSTVKRAFERYPFLPALIILVVLIALNGWFQPRSLSLVGVTGLVKTYLALMLL